MKPTGKKQTEKRQKQSTARCAMLVSPSIVLRPIGGRVSVIIHPKGGKEDAGKRKRLSVEQIVAVLSKNL